MNYGRTAVSLGLLALTLCVFVGNLFIGLWNQSHLTAFPCRLQSTLIDSSLSLMFAIPACLAENSPSIWGSCHVECHFGMLLWMRLSVRWMTGGTDHWNFPLGVVNCIRLGGIIHQFALCLGSLQRSGHPLGLTKDYRASVPRVKLTEIIWMECLLNCQSLMKAPLSRRGNGGLYDLSKHSSRFLPLTRENILLVYNCFKQYNQ